MNTTTANIKNLIQTEWADQFDKTQLGEIKFGLDLGLDVSYYTNPDFNWGQMKQIRLGLESNVDVTTYANPDYSWKEMKEMRLKLEMN